ncbi:MAG: type I-E CRISPR-associated protein Cse1/CasA [Clostridiales bacterium]|nr:type I-E CRISPR-associated protein Cse1/CasA [Clostridiales bacterium]
MGRYNLLDEKWIMVLREDTGQTEKVSLKEVFAHAGDYHDLAGEMKTQDFAILRVLLAVLQTVFSRFDSEGNSYDFVEINEKTFQQMEPVDQDDLPDEDPYFETWLSLWKKGEFPEIVQDYLEAWRDHFYLFDDKNPFYQVTPDEMEEIVKDKYKDNVKDKGNTGKLFGRCINRTISESNNTHALFAPAVETPDGETTKDNLNNDQLARWLIMFQGYTGTSDKSEIKDVKNTTKGWLYELGGIYLKGHNLFETLMLNCILSSDFDDEIMIVQIPSWERTPLENIKIYFHNQIDNKASLYTNWSRAISFMDDYQEGKPFYCFPAKLQKIDYTENFLEPMTCWQKKKSGNYKDKFIPNVHKQDEASWRHFNALMGVGQENGVYFRQPGIISWYNAICENDAMKHLRNYRITICSVSMQIKDSKSNMPADEIIDEIQMETAVLIDNNKGGWIEQIITLIDETKNHIDKTLIHFVEEIGLIRLNKDKKSLSNKDTDYLKDLKNKEREKLYMEIDQSFREWLYEIKETDSMNEKALKWYKILKKSILNSGEEKFKNANFKDLKGIQLKENSFMNIATAYNKFRLIIDDEFSFLQEGGNNNECGNRKEN